MITLYISSDVLSFIEIISRAHPKTEVGGIIGGRKVSPDKIEVLLASNSGPKAEKKKFFFLRDNEYCQRILDSWVASSQRKIDYLGEWHKHLEEYPNPSSTDFKTMMKISNDPDYHIDDPLLFIIGKSNCRKSLKTFIIVDRKRLTEVNWIELTDHS